MMCTLKRNLRGLIKNFSNNDVNAQAFCTHPVAFCVQPVAFCIHPVAFCIHSVAFCIIQGGIFCLSCCRLGQCVVCSGLTGRVSDSRVFR